MLALAAGVSAQELPAHTSVGTPQNGRVAGGGVALAPRGPGYHWVTNRGNAAASFGTPSLVAALARAAAEVARVHPGSDLAIHDLGFESGGRIRGHGSHTSGRDADVAYYATNASGARIDPTTSVWFDPSGRARGVASATAVRFDAARTALFLSTLLEDRSIRVQYVFMHPALQRLVRSAAGRHASQLTRVLRTPRGRRVDPHADHLHVRIHCPPADVAYGCADR
jgi:penicillin-insensitive murein endopeptidase